MSGIGCSDSDGANGLLVGFISQALLLNGVLGMYGVAVAALGGVLGLEGPATDSRSIAGSDIVRKFPNRSRSLENISLKRGKKCTFFKSEENTGEEACVFT